MAKKHWYYSHSGGQKVGRMICGSCHRPVEGWYRYREGRDGYVVQHRQCCADDPAWKQIDKESQETAARDPDSVWAGLDHEQKDAVLMAAAMFQRLGSVAQQIGATGGIKTTRFYAAQPDVRAAVSAMFPILPLLQAGGYDIASEREAERGASAA